MNQTSVPSPILPSRVLALLTFAAIEFSAGHALAAITFNVESPCVLVSPDPGIPPSCEDGGVPVEGTSINVTVVVFSTYAVQTASAQCGTASATLTAPSSAGGAWTGSLAVAGLSYGPQTLSITATD